MAVHRVSELLPTMSSPSFRTKVFVSYSHRDRALKEKFDDNLRVLKVQGLIDFWTDGELLPGDCWSDEITKAMNEANLILFLVSNPFISSTFIREKEAPMAIERQKRGEAVIVPILLHDTPGWFDEAWSSLEALPSEVKPVDHPDWRTPENAFANVEKRLRELIKALPKKLAAAQATEAPQTAEKDIPRPRTPESGITPLARPKKLPLFVGVSLVTLVAIALVARHYFQSDDPSAPAPTVEISQGAPPSAPTPANEAPAPPSTTTPAADTPPPDRVELGRLISAPAITPELRAWLDSVDVVDRKLTISAAKENGIYQSGLQSLRTNDVVVCARRTPSLLWKADGKTYQAKNGITWDLAFDLEGTGAESDKFSFSVYFKAEKKSGSTASSEVILVDGKDPFTKSSIVAASDAPPSFTHAHSGSFSPSQLQVIWKVPTLNLSIYAGEEGQIAARRHQCALEIKKGDRPVHRSIFYLDVPPLLYDQPTKEWVNTIAPKVDSVSLVENSVFWCSENELVYSVRVDGDPKRLRSPIMFLSHFAACDVSDAFQKPWVVDPSPDQSCFPSDEIEGFDFLTASWAFGTNNQLGFLDWRGKSAIQQLSLKAGPRGKFATGRYDLALQISEYGLPAWRGILNLKVPEKPWAFTDDENHLDLTSMEGQDIRRTVLAARRAQPPFPEGLSNGIGFGPLKFKCKGAPLEGTFLIQYYVRASRAPNPPSGINTISAGQYDGIYLFDHPDEGGFTARAAGAYPIGPQSKDSGGILKDLAFYVGADATHPGEISPGYHAVGIEILHRETPNATYRPVYRGITNLWLAE